MSRRETVQPTLDEHGYEQHPAWGLIGASRVTISPPGSSLFDSDIKHQHTVVVRIGTAMRQRDLHRDWIGRSKQFVEVEMSEAQWASFVSSMNSGEGVPCTIRSQAGEGELPGFPDEARLRESIDEVRGKAQEVFAEIKEAFKLVEEKPTKENIRNLKYKIENAPPNIAFAGESLTEHAENVVQRARADIEAMVVSKARQLGIDPADLTMPELTTGKDSNEHHD